MRLLFIFFGLILLLVACVTKYGSGKIISENRSLQNFTGIEVGGDFDVEVVSGKDYNVKIEADDNVMPYVITEMDGDRLKLSLAKNFSVNDGHLKAYISAPVIKYIQASASAKITSPSGINSEDKVELSTSSAGSIKTAVDAPAVKLGASSGSEIEASGMCKTLTGSASSGASVKAADLLSENADVSASSGGSVRLYSSVNLKAQASSGGSIRYSGTPSTQIEKSSGGSVSKD